MTLLDTLELASHTVRTLTLSKVITGVGRRGLVRCSSLLLCCYCSSTTFQKSGSSEKRDIRQFQLMAWPDHGVPECATPTLAFLRRVKACHPLDSGPMVVHCRYAAPNRGTKDPVGG